ncbi:MAG: nucleotidyltransferase family protein [Paludibacter sp.]|nr:nucleotidyltransferase family protein [Paludibacter sp.]
MKAMIFAAGLGTRLKPLTDAMPKALVPIGEKPLLEHIILKMKMVNVNEIIINIYHFGEQIIDFLNKNNNFGIKITISDERDALLDTGGGLRKAAWFFSDNKPFLVHNVDIFSNVDFAKLYANHLKNNVLATLVVSGRQTQRYFLFDENNYLQGWINTAANEVKPANLQNINNLKRLAFAGIQILSPKVFDFLEKMPQAKFSLTDFYLQNTKNQCIKAYIPPDFKMLDIGKIDVLSQAENFNYYPAQPSLSKFR